MKRAGFRAFLIYFRMVEKPPLPELFSMLSKVLSKSNLFLISARQTLASCTMWRACNFRRKLNCWQDTRGPDNASCFPSCWTWTTRCRTYMPKLPGRKKSGTWGKSARLQRAAGFFPTKTPFYLLVTEITRWEKDRL